MDIIEARETISHLLNLGYKKCNILDTLNITGDIFERILDEDETVPLQILETFPLFNENDWKYMKEAAEMVNTISIK